MLSHFQKEVLRAGGVAGAMSRQNENEYLHQADLSWAICSSHAATNCTKTVFVLGLARTPQTCRTPCIFKSAF